MNHIILESLFLTDAVIILATFTGCLFGAGRLSLVKVTPWELYHLESRMVSGSLASPVQPGPVNVIILLALIARFDFPMG